MKASHPPLSTENPEFAKALQKVLEDTFETPLDSQKHIGVSASVLIETPAIEKPPFSSLPPFIQWNGCIGYSDPFSKKETTPNTYFGLGSITKSFTAVYFLKLIEEGKLHLNEIIFKYITALARNPRIGTNLTIEDLLRMRGGIDNIPLDLIDNPSRNVETHIWSPIAVLSQIGHRGAQTPLNAVELTDWSFDQINKMASLSLFSKHQLSKMKNQKYETKYELKSDFLNELEKREVFEGKIAHYLHSEGLQIFRHVFQSTDNLKLFDSINLLVKSIDQEYHTEATFQNLFNSIKSNISFLLSKNLSPPNIPASNSPLDLLLDSLTKQIKKDATPISKLLDRLYEQSTFYKLSESDWNKLNKELSNFSASTLNSLKAKVGYAFPSKTLFWKFFTQDFSFYKLGTINKFKKFILKQATKFKLTGQNLFGVLEEFSRHYPLDQELATYLQKEGLNKIKNDFSDPMVYQTLNDLALAMDRDFEWDTSSFKKLFEPIVGKFILDQYWSLFSYYATQYQLTQDHLDTLKIKASEIPESILNELQAKIETSPHGFWEFSNLSFDMETSPNLVEFKDQLISQTTKKQKWNFHVLFHFLYHSASNSLVKKFKRFIDKKRTFLSKSALWNTVLEEVGREADPFKDLIFAKSYSSAIETFRNALKTNIHPQEIEDYGAFMEKYLKYTYKACYSNTNYILLGIILENLDHKRSLSQMFKEDLFDVHGWEHLYFGGDHSEQTPVATSFTQTGVVHSLRLISKYQQALTAGAMIGTATDVASFYDALFRKKTILRNVDHYYPVLKHNLTQITDNAFHLTGYLSGDEMKYLRYGMGVIKITIPQFEESNKEETFDILVSPKMDVKESITGYGHTGALNGFFSHAYYFPSLKATIVLLQNNSSTEMTALGNKAYIKLLRTIETFLGHQKNH